MTFLPELPGQLMPVVREVVQEAGDIALRFFRSGLTTSARIWSKAGGSPVTEADVTVDTFLKVRLSQLLPQAGWLSEETADDARRLGRDLVWIVDPIDGTRAFLAGNHDWSVAVALLQDGVPVLGIVHAPAHEALYEAVNAGGALRNGEAIGVSSIGNLADASVTGPKPFVDPPGPNLRQHEAAAPDPVARAPIARVAEGSVDVGLVSSEARDWDIAAADIVLLEAGGSLCDLSGRRPVYNQAEPVHGELVAAPRRLQAPLIEVITR